MHTSLCRTRSAVRHASPQQEKLSAAPENMLGHASTPENQAGRPPGRTCRWRAGRWGSPCQTCRGGPCCWAARRSPPHLCRHTQHPFKEFSEMPACSICRKGKLARQKASSPLAAGPREGFHHTPAAMHSTSQDKCCTGNCCIVTADCHSTVPEEAQSSHPLQGGRWSSTAKSGAGAPCVAPGCPARCTTPLQGLILECRLALGRGGPSKPSCYSTWCRYSAESLCRLWHDYAACAGRAAAQLLVT